MSKKSDTADETYMRRAIELAEKGAGRTSPNPMVGMVLVRTAAQHDAVYLKKQKEQDDFTER